MSCEVVIYEVETINDDYDVLLNYKTEISGYDFLEHLPYGVSLGYNSIKYGDLLNALKVTNNKTSYLDKEKDYVLYVSY